VRYATALAVLAAAIMFGLAHSYQGPGGAQLAAGVGLILGLVYIQQHRTICVKALVHGMVDTTAMVLLFLGVRFV
jgi:membrane protease YdiL (CAAX protease family)